MTCPLCSVEHKTRWFYEDDRFLVIECLRCHEPMGVLREHRATFTEPEKREICKLFRLLFGTDKPIAWDHGAHARCHLGVKLPPPESLPVIEPT